MKNLSMILPALLALAVLPTTALAQAPESPGPCSVEVPRAQEELEALRTDPDLEWARQEFGLVGLGIDSAQLLSGPRDASVCARLRREVPRTYATRGPSPKFDITYYELAAGYLIVVTNQFEPESREIPSSRGQTIILNQDMELVGTLVN